MPITSLPSPLIELQGPVSIQVVNEILSIYRPEHRYVSDAVLNDTAMRCKLKPTVYPYTEKQIFDYITAPTVTIFGCQMAYVLIGSMVIAKHTLVASIKTREHFASLRDAALLRFGRFNIRFLAEVENKYPIPAHIKIGTIRCISGCIHCLMDFSIGDGICGNIHGVLLGNS